MTQELDPRWIVKEMGEEGKNVGNWHWTERNCIPWAQKVLKKSFSDHLFQTTQFRAKIEFENITGDCIVMNRKGRFIAVYEIKIEMKWKAELFKEDNVKANGKVIIPYIGEENDVDEFKINWELDAKTNKSKHEKLYGSVQQYTEKGISEKITAFLKELRSGADYKHLLPTSTTKTPGKKIKKIIEKPVQVVVVKKEPSKKSKKKQELKIKEKFKVGKEIIFQCFLDPRRVAAFTQSKPQVEARAGGNVNYYNGRLVGKITKLVSGKELEFSVRMADWATGEFSKVNMKFSEKDGSCSLILNQSGIPLVDRNGARVNVKSLDRFWKEMFLKRIDVMFGRGFRF